MVFHLSIDLRHVCTPISIRPSVCTYGYVYVCICMQVCSLRFLCVFIIIIYINILYFIIYICIFIYFFIGQSRLQTNDLPIHPGFWPTYNDIAGRRTTMVELFSCLSV